MIYGRTAYNRPVCVPGLAALQGSIRLGRLRLPRLIPPTFCQPWSLLRKALIRAGKTSHTAGTLCAIPPKFFVNKKHKNYTAKCEKWVDAIKNMG
jgi:hypothetical protein